MAFHPYQPSNKESLIHIFRLNVPKYFDASEEKEFSNYLQLKADTYFCIFENETLLGGVGYEFKEEDQSGRINWIFLHPNYRGEGLGKKAVEHCLGILKADTRVKTLIVRTSQLIYPFFEKCGYTLLRTEKDYWAKGFDLYQMEKSID